MDIHKKLELLSSAARYDAACASSGSQRMGPGVGAAHPSGICHSWSADGRCISLLKVLQSNHCRFDCAYCTNRASNNHPRASFTPEELADLTLAFYRRNYIEGLFLSSAVRDCADNTMERMLHTLRLLRRKHRFHGYIHLKVIPGASPELMQQAAALADRMSANIELPTRASLNALAPDKEEGAILRALQPVMPDRQLARRDGPLNPAGMSTQMLIGASPEPDLTVLQRAETLYRDQSLKRVYYSAYIPVNKDARLPAHRSSPPLEREHRLYQADWLLRFYRFEVSELLDPAMPDLDLTLDPKAAWALRHLEHFPLDVNQAAREELLRIPGIGLRSVQRILTSRRQQTLHAEDLHRLGVVMKRARYFLQDRGRYLGNVPLQEDHLRSALSGAKQARQLDLPFAAPTETSRMALTGEF